MGWAEQMVSGPVTGPVTRQNSLEGVNIVSSLRPGLIEKDEAAIDVLVCLANRICLTCFHEAFLPLIFRVRRGSLVA
jgi:hypothetical protein